MKKLKVAIISLICLVCMSLGITMLTDVKSVNAQSVEGATPTLSETKVMVSAANDKMLLATAIKDKDDVYKVGYTFTSNVETIFAETTKYYSSITSGNTTLTPTDIFSEEWADEDGVGMIIWEVSFSLATTYEYKAYALVGERNEQGKLVIPETEVEITPNTANRKTFYTVSFDTDGGNAIDAEIAPVGTNLTMFTSVESFKPGYDFVRWQLNDENVSSNAKVSENVTLKAVYTEANYNEYTPYKFDVHADLRYVQNDMIHFELPEQLKGYDIVYAKLASFGDGTYQIKNTVVNEDGTVDMPKGEPVMGKNVIQALLYKDEAYAAAEITLYKGDMVIADYNGLKEFHDTLEANGTENKYFVLAADVDWKGGDWKPGWNKEGNNFWGILDGCGYTIANYASHYGLCQNNQGTIKNVRLKPLTKGGAAGGGVCLLNGSYGKIENCIVEVTVTAGEDVTTIAGIAKNNVDGTIKNCIAILNSYTPHPSYAGANNINAIAVEAGTIENCYAINNVDGSCVGQFKYMYSNSVTDGLYSSVNDFFQYVRALSSAKGWSNYWSIENGTLYFNKQAVLAFDGNYEDYNLLVNNGDSDYSILIPNSPSYELNIAAEELAYFFKIATGIDLPITKNSAYSDSGKYISLGATAISGAVSVSQAELGNQGFRIVTVDDDIVIKSVADFGTLWGVYELLAQMFDYEYYARDVYYIDTDVEMLLLEEYDISDKPDIDQRVIGDSQGNKVVDGVLKTDRETAHRMRQIEVWGEFALYASNPHHNSFDYVRDDNGTLPTRFLSTGGTKPGSQLCYTGHGDDSVVEEMLNRSIAYLEKAMNKTTPYRKNTDAIFGIQDDNGWCACSACTNVITKYGTKSATIILFMNKLRDKLDAYLEENNIDTKINLYFFAYMEIEEPPVHKNANGEWVANDPSLVCKDGLGIMFAPIYANFTQSIYSEANKETYERLQSFKALTNKLLVWTYACYYEEYFAPFDTFTYMQDWFEAVVDNNGTYLFNQGMQDQGNSSQFDILRQYLVSKLGWDVDADVDALTDEFFDVYFGKAKAPMRQMYDELRERMRYNYDTLRMAANTSAKSDYYETKYWPKDLLLKWKGLIDQAYELADGDEALQQRILLESIFVRYYLLKLYPETASNLTEAKAQLISDAKAVGIVRASSHRTIDELFKSNYDL